MLRVVDFIAVSPVRPYVLAFPKLLRVVDFIAVRSVRPYVIAFPKLFSLKQYSMLDRSLPC